MTDNEKIEFLEGQIPLCNNTTNLEGWLRDLFGHTYSINSDLHQGVGRLIQHFYNDRLDKRKLQTLDPKYRSLARQMLKDHIQHFKLLKTSLETPTPLPIPKEPQQVPKQPEQQKPVETNRPTVAPEKTVLQKKLNWSPIVVNPVTDQKLQSDKSWILIGKCLAIVGLIASIMALIPPVRKHLRSK